MTEKQTLVLIISRFQLDASLIPPLKIIIPMLSNLYPVRVFTSLDGQIIGNKNRTIYDQLVRRLQSNAGFCCLTQVLLSIIKQYEQKQKSTNYRVCILGHERVDWSVVMEFKRRNIVVDTVCGNAQKSQLLVQVSYITEGIHKMVKENAMVKCFEAELGMSSKVRQYFKTQKKETVQFSLKCCHCSTQITGIFYSCSICLNVYCGKHENAKQCQRCGYVFD